MQVVKKFGQALFLFTILFSACSSFVPTIPIVTATFVVQLPTTIPSATPEPSPTLTPVPTLTPTALTCLQEGGTLEEIFQSSDILPQRMEFIIYLPPCYEAFPDRAYPVLYLIHGQSFRQDQWDRLGVDELADEKIAAGEYPPFIIVMPRDWIWTQPAADPFGDAVMQELIPSIDETYRTIPDRDHRAIGGLSRGAGWAVHLGLIYWEDFGSIGAHSLPVFWEDTPFIDNWFAEIPSEEIPYIYVDIGDRDRVEIKDSTFWFIKQLETLSIPHEWHYFVGYHNEEYWSAHLEDYLDFYTQNW